MAKFKAVELLCVDRYKGSQNHTWFVSRAKDNMLYRVLSPERLILRWDLYTMRRYNLSDFILTGSILTISGSLCMKILVIARSIASSQKNFPIDAITVAELYRKR